MPGRSPYHRTPLSRRISKVLKGWLVALAVATIPRLYLAYMWLVWKTSSIEWIGLELEDVRNHYGRAVAVLWHDEVFFVAYAFRRFRGHTLASHGDFGEVIARMLELCNFRVFRGGSSSGQSRRSPEIVSAMVENMNRHPGVIYGITVDGSKGPVYRMKRGALRIATECRAPVVVQKTWCRRYFRLPTWDRTLIPLPFNRIVHVFGGPYLPPPAGDSESFDRFCERVEGALLDVTYHARTLVEGTGAADLLANYPEGWKPRREEPELVLPFAEVATDPSVVPDDGMAVAGGR